MERNPPSPSVVSPTLLYIWKGRNSGALLTVIPAQAGIQLETWTPTFVGVTNVKEFLGHCTKLAFRKIVFLLLGLGLGLLPQGRPINPMKEIGRG